MGSVATAAVPGGGTGVRIVNAIPGGGYEARSGTSMAAPHVAGTIALILQAAGWLYYSIPDIPAYGGSRIDAYEAVRKALEYAAFEYAKKSLASPYHGLQ